MSSFKSFDDPREIKRRMNELGIDDFVPNSFPRVESRPEEFPGQLTEYHADRVYSPVRQQAKIADLLEEALTLEQIRLLSARQS